MAKSRVEKNKELYDKLELESFELEDLGDSANNKKKEQSNQENKQVEKKKEELAPVKKVKKQELVKVEEEKDEDYVVEQPLSYTSRLSVEEILRVKLEKQQQLKQDKRVYKKTPVTKEYTSEMMQKNIKQNEGIDVRKEANIKVRHNNNLIIFLLVLLLIAVIAAGVIVGYILVNKKY